ncbi:hypothetical protein SM611_30185 [Actinomadura sp. DLS-62]|uniref:Uncharacterized protein n=1 Tax=Actinomadura monticuli TaxID=3097367 RepID=A0ABV4QJ77_9ACTN
MAAGGLFGRFGGVRADRVDDVQVLGQGDVRAAGDQCQLELEPRTFCARSRWSTPAAVFWPLISTIRPCSDLFSAEYSSTWPAATAARRGRWPGHRPRRVLVRAAFADHRTLIDDRHSVSGIM